MGIFDRVVGFFSSSAPPEDARSEVHGEEDAEMEDEGEQTIRKDRFPRRRHDPMDVDGNEEEEEFARPQHTPRAVLPRSQTHAQKKSEQSSASVRESGVSMVNGWRQDGTESGVFQRPQTTWTPINATSLSQESRSGGELNAGSQSHSAGKPRAGREVLNDQFGEEEDENNEQRKAPAPRKRKTGNGGGRLEENGTANGAQSSSKTGRTAASEKIAGPGVAGKAFQKPEPPAKRSVPAKRTAVGESDLPSSKRSKSAPRKRKGAKELPDESRQDSEEDINVITNLLNSAVKRGVSDTSKTNVVRPDAESGHQSTPAPTLISSTIDTPKTVTPQVIIRSRPRPTLLSLNGSGKRPHDVSTTSASEEDSTPVLNRKPMTGASVTGEPDSIHLKKQANPIRPPIKPPTSHQRKAINEAEMANSAKRVQTVKPAEIESAAMEVVAPQEPLSDNHTRRDTPKFTPQRILPPPSVFRSQSSLGQSSQQNPRTSTPSLSKPQSNDTPSIRKNTPILPPSVKTSSVSKTLQKKKSITPINNSQQDRLTNGVRQTNLESFVSTTRRASAAAAVSPLESQPPMPSNSRPANQQNHANNDHEHGADTDTDSRTPSRNHSAITRSNSKQKGKSDLSNQQDSPPRRPTLRRKRRMPSFDEEEPIVKPTRRSNVKKLTPARAEKSNPSSASKTGLKHSLDTPKTGQADSPGIELRLDARLRAQGFDQDKLDIISEAIANFGRHQELDQVQLNALVQRVKKSDEEVKMLWDEVCSQVPDLDVKLVQKLCRRHYHNYIVGPWSEEQDEELREAYEMHPNKWTVISELINRFPELARLRYRDYASCSSRNKDVWTLEEEEKLRRVYHNYLEQVRAEKANSADQALLEASDESLIDWNTISIAMDRTRSRMQCFQKWTKIQAREAVVNTVDLAPLPDTPWRIEEALTHIDDFSSTEKLRILRAIKNTGAASEDKIPWRLISNDFKPQYQEKSMAMKILFRNLRSCVQGHQEMDLQDVLSFIIAKYEEAAPDEPAGFDQIDKAVKQATQQVPVRTPHKSSSHRQRSATKKGSTSKKGGRKTTSKMRSQAQSNLHREEGTPVPVPARQQKKVREGMRSSDQTTFPSPKVARTGEDGEDIAEELRMTWTQNGTTPRAKRPLVKPRISQVREQRVPSDDEEDQLNPSPPSDIDEDYSQPQNEDNVVQPIVGKDSRLLSPQRHGVESQSPDEEAEAEQNTPRRLFLDDKTRVSSDEDDVEEEEASTSGSIDDPASHLDYPRAELEAETEEGTFHSDFEHEPHDEVTDEVPVDREDGSGVVHTEVNSPSSSPSQQESYDDIEIKEEEDDDMESMPLHDHLQSQQDFKEHSPLMSEQMDDEIVSGSESFSGSQNNSELGSAEPEDSPLHNGDEQMRSVKSHRYRSPPPPARSLSEEYSSPDSDSDGETIQPVKIVETKLAVNARSPSSEVPSEESRLHGGSIAYAGTDSSSCSSHDNRDDAKESHRITTNGWSPHPATETRNEEYSDTTSSSAAASSGEEREAIVLKREFEESINDLQYPEIPHSDNGGSDDEDAFPQPSIKKAGPWDYARWKAEREAPEHSSDDDSDSDVSSILADAPPKSRVNGRMGSIEL